MQFVRGDPRDYDHWNLPQWSFKEMLPYLKKLECIDLDMISSNEKYRNQDPNNGMIDVTMLKDSNEMNQLFIQSCLNNGFCLSKDYNSEENLNGIVSMSQVSTKNGKRCSTASAYLLSAIKRTNLHILTHTHVCRVVFDQNKHVNGKFDSKFV